MHPGLLTPLLYRVWWVFIVAQLVVSVVCFAVCVHIAFDGHISDQDLHSEHALLLMKEK